MLVKVKEYFTTRELIKAVSDGVLSAGRYGTSDEETIVFISDSSFILCRGDGYGIFNRAFQVTYEKELKDSDSLPQTVVIIGDEKVLRETNMSVYEIVSKYSQVSAIYTPVNGELIPLMKDGVPII